MHSGCIHTHACGYELLSVCVCACAAKTLWRLDAGEWLEVGGFGGGGGGVAAAADEAAGRTPASLLAPGAPLLSK